MEELDDYKNRKLLKRDLKKGKVFAIHHVTRRIRLLRKKIGTKQQVEKNIRKADRLQEEIVFIKDFDVDDVLKKIQNEPDLLEKCVNMDGIVNIEERALARLISSKPVQNRLKDVKGSKKNAKKTRQEEIVGDIAAATDRRLLPHKTESMASLSESAASSDDETNDQLSESCDETKLERTATSLFVKSMASLSENRSKKKRNSQKKKSQKPSNRLGQRARQRLWQEKYGKKAHHMKSNDKIKKKDVGRSKPDNQKIKPKKALKPKQKEEAKHGATNHPSWEASKRRKLQQNISETQFQGKKIIFED